MILNSQNSIYINTSCHLNTDVYNWASWILCQERFLQLISFILLKFSLTTISLAAWEFSFLVMTQPSPIWYAFFNLKKVKYCDLWNIYAAKKKLSLTGKKESQKSVWVIFVIIIHNTIWWTSSKVLFHDVLWSFSF